VGVPHHHPLHFSLAVEQHSDLAVGLEREVGEVPGQLGTDDLVRGDPAAVGVTELLQLAWLEAEGVPGQVFQGALSRGQSAARVDDLAMSRPLRSGEQPAGAANRPPASVSGLTEPPALVHCGRWCPGALSSSSSSPAVRAVLLRTSGSKLFRSPKRFDSMLARSRAFTLPNRGFDASAWHRRATGSSSCRRPRARAPSPSWSCCTGPEARRNPSGLR